MTIELHRHRSDAPAPRRGPGAGTRTAGELA